MLRTTFEMFFHNSYHIRFLLRSTGLRGYELIQTVGKVSLQGGGTFGTFMAIGTGIRC